MISPIGATPSTATPTTMAYEYKFMFAFEKVYPTRWTVWMQENWYYSIFVSLVYAAMVYGGQRMMKHQRAFNLRTPLIIWNFALAIFSILGTIRFCPTFINSLSNFGLYQSVCISTYAYGVPGFWANQFANSKILELGDTAFLIARKRPVIFLHWYHHVTVLVYSWHAYKDHTAAGQWFIVMNFFVHSFMYTYYTIRAIGWRVPRPVSMGVTALQITQMISGVLVTVSVYLYKIQGHFCQQTFGNIHFAFFIYFSYFCLFTRFFYDAYIKGTKWAIGGKKRKDPTPIPTPTHSKTPYSSHSGPREGQGDFNPDDKSPTELRFRSSVQQ